MKYKSRTRYISDIVQLCDFLCSDIMFNQQLLKISLERFCLQCGEEIKCVLTEYVRQLERYEFLEIDKIEQIVEKGVLKPTVMSKFVSLLYNLGKSDSYTQIESIKSYKQAIIPDLDDARTEQKKYGSLYSKLGLVVGIAIAVLIY